MYAIIDIEATGGSAKRDKITEIAVFLYDGKALINTFHSLINPKVAIPVFISKLTGITNNMVAEAPTFAEIADELFDIMKDAVFVAHNVQFDYAYIKAEFKRLGYVFQRPKLCTIEYTKCIFPNMESYSLGNLCKALDIPIHNRHRANGDAEATLKLFQYLQVNDKEDFLNQSLFENRIIKSLPKELPTHYVNTLPEDVGIYYLHDYQGKALYVGKSNDIRRRVFQHFSTISESRRGQMLRKVRSISFEATGSELIAQLMEYFELKRLQPTHNRTGQFYRRKYGIYKQYTRGGYIRLFIRKQKAKEKERPLVVFNKLEEAQKILHNKIRKYRLCGTLCSLKPITNAACELHEKGRCAGACLGKEEVVSYNKRAQKATKAFEYPHYNFMLIGEGRTIAEKSAICIEQGRFAGMGYFDTTHIQALDEMKAALTTYEETPEVTQMIQKYLKKTNLDQIVPYQIKGENRLPISVAI